MNPEIQRATDTCQQILHDAAAHVAQGDISGESVRELEQAHSQIPHDVVRGCVFAAQLAAGRQSLGDIRQQWSASSRLPEDTWRLFNPAIEWRFIRESLSLHDVYKPDEVAKAKLPDSPQLHALKQQILHRHILDLAQPGTTDLGKQRYNLSVYGRYRPADIYRQLHTPQNPKHHSILQVTTVDDLDLETWAPVPMRDELLDEPSSDVGWVIADTVPYLTDNAAIDPGRYRAFTTMLETVLSLHGPQDQLILDTHGNEHRLKLAHDIKMVPLRLNEPRWLDAMSMISKVIKPGGTLTLTSCMSGLVGGLAQVISTRLPDIRVEANSGNASVKWGEIEQTGDLVKAQVLYPEYRGNGYVRPSIYCNGILLPTT